MTPLASRPANPWEASDANGFLGPGETFIGHIRLIPASAARLSIPAEPASTQQMGRIQIPAPSVWG